MLFFTTRVCFCCAGSGRGAVFDILPTAQTGQGRAQHGRPDGPVGQVRDGERQQRRGVQGFGHVAVRVPHTHGTASRHGRHHRV